ncbi:MAG: transglutaminase domain-containing protein [Chitinophagaceae bacterium]
MLSKLYFLCIGLLFFSGNPFAQEKSNVKFGNVSEKDFNTKIYPIDSNASAVVIADIGYSAIEGNTKGWFSLVYKHFKRLHIINKNGYDAANVSISLYADGDAEEELNKLKAVTYNLENGKVVETKLDVKASVFKDKISKNRVVKKFTFPNVKEGSIIEYEYTITSDFLQNLQPWEFQGAYPRLWSEYNLALPEFLGYVFLTRGYKKYDINDKKLRSESFTILDSRGIGASERYQFTANVSDNRWVMKNVPALKEESFTSTIDNHIAKIEFQLSEYRQPLTYRNIMGSWPKLANDLMEADFFGKPVTKDNGWLKDIVKPLIEGVNGNKEKAHKIFAYVRDNFTCTNHSDLFAEQTLKNLEKSKSGTVAEINLLLTAMLRYADIEADPVILSTRSNGMTYPLYPLITQYNYVIARIIIDGKTFYLDASEPRLGFGHLPVRCYNGHGRVINKTADAIELESDSLMERKSTTVFVVNDEKGNIVGSMLQTPGYYESFNLRERIKEKGKEQLITDIKKAFGTEILVSKFELDSLDKYEEVLGIKYDFDFTGEKEDIIYLNPMFGEGYKENPFKSAERLYPVEMPYGFDETYTLQMDVPSGYEVDELPKSMVVKLNEENEGMFEYRISQSGSGISFRSRIRISRAYFMPEEYEMLREFFNLVVKKQAEQIVLKKKK